MVWAICLWALACGGQKERDLSTESLVRGRSGHHLTVHLLAAVHNLSARIGDRPSSSGKIESSVVTLQIEAAAGRVVKVTNAVVEATA